MEFSCCLILAIAISFLLIGIPAIGQSAGRELRPSDHGLAYQKPPATTKVNKPEMLAFFRGNETKLPLPRARNLTDPSWWGPSTAGGRGKGGHVRGLLLVTSLVCGISGVVLLAVAALLFLFRFQKRRRSKSPSSGPPPPPLPPNT